MCGNLRPWARKRQLGLLAAVYLFLAALAIPSSLPAAEEHASKDENEQATPADAQSGEPKAAPPRAPAPAGAPVQQPADQRPAVAARSDASGEKPVARAAGPGAVRITDFSFGPRTITVNVGDTVTWTNTAATPHSAAAKDGSFDTGVFRKGQRRSHTFSKAGSFAYICTPHPFMKGTVRVAASGSGGSGGQDGGGGGGSGGGSDSSGSAAGAGESASTARTSAGEEGAGESRSAGSSAPRLPASGADARPLAGLGVLMVLLGLLIRRREREAGA